MNPARKGTSAVASDQVKTPILRTFLQQEDNWSNVWIILPKLTLKQRQNASSMFMHVLLLQSLQIIDKNTIRNCLTNKLKLLQIVWLVLCKRIWEIL